MKKIIVMLLVMLAVAISTSVYAQKSTMYVGDKNSSEITKSSEIYSTLISSLELKKSNLEKSRNKMLRKPGENQYLIIKTDSIIGLYQDKIMQLEEEQIAFTIASAGKDEQNIINIKSRNLPALTDAIIAVNYYGKNNKNVDNLSLMSDSALITNDWHREVYVSISGPAKFHTGFKINGKSTVAFEIPGPGSYGITYDFGNEKKFICKKFDGFNKEFVPETKAKYAFISGINRR